MTDTPTIPKKDIFEKMKLEIIVTVDVDMDWDGEDSHEKRFIFIRPEKLKNLKQDDGIIGDILKEISETF